MGGTRKRVSPRVAKSRFRELDLNPETPHIATRPTMAFHGSMQVAVAETKNMVEHGYRVAFFAPSNGELERLADILREYSVPFQLGLAPNEAASPYLAERAYLAGPVAAHLSDQRAGPPRRHVSRIRRSPSSAPRICSIRPI